MSQQPATGVPQWVLEGRANPGAPRPETPPSGYTNLPSSGPSQAPAVGAPYGGATAVGTPVDSTTAQGVAVGGVPGANRYSNQEPGTAPAGAAYGYSGAYGSTSETTYVYAEGPPGRPYGARNEVYIQEMMLGDTPCECFCPNCHRVSMTRVEEYAGWLPWSIFTVSCICFMLPLCCVFCGPCLMDKVHTCGHCGMYIGRRPACT